VRLVPIEALAWLCKPWQVISSQKQLTISFALRLKIEGEDLIAQNISRLNLIQEAQFGHVIGLLRAEAHNTIRMQCLQLFGLVEGQELDSFGFPIFDEEVIL